MDEDQWNKIPPPPFYNPIILKPPKLNTSLSFQTNPAMSKESEYCYTPKPELSGMVSIASQLSRGIKENVLKDDFEIGGVIVNKGTNEFDLDPHQVENNDMEYNITDINEEEEVNFKNCSTPLGKKESKGKDKEENKTLYPISRLMKEISDLDSLIPYNSIKAALKIDFNLKDEISPADFSIYIKGLRSGFNFKNIKKSDDLNKILSSEIGILKGHSSDLENIIKSHESVYQAGQKEFNEGIGNLSSLKTCILKFQDTLKDKILTNQVIKVPQYDGNMGEIIGKPLIETLFKIYKVNPNWEIKKIHFQKNLFMDIDIKTDEHKKSFLDFLNQQHSHIRIMFSLLAPSDVLNLLKKHKKVFCISQIGAIAEEVLDYNKGQTSTALYTQENFILKLIKEHMELSFGMFSSNKN